MPGPSVRAHEHAKGVFWAIRGQEKKLATRNLVPGTSVYDEELVKYDRQEYRLWDPYRSKLAATLIKGLEQLPITPHSRLLYLGAGTGTTVSHVSDIVDEAGRVYCVEFAAAAMRRLIENLLPKRRNIVPILEDARHPLRYRPLVSSVDALYCDVAQPEQAKILADNAEFFLGPGQQALLAVKSRSIDVTMSPAEVYEREEETLESRGFTILQKLRLDPFEDDHMMIRTRFEGSHE